MQFFPKVFFRPPALDKIGSNKIGRIKSDQSDRMDQTDEFGEPESLRDKELFRIEPGLGDT